jgi:hypothetical protein
MNLFERVLIKQSSCLRTPVSPSQVLQNAADSSRQPISAELFNGMLVAHLAIIYACRIVNRQTAKFASRVTVRVPQQYDRFATVAAQN